ncbi:LLM class flavin-dependent oxidoreductase [Rhodococcus sp. NPDC060090]|uniref:LLM class flavin-dependent oxidoreductase n=1 Tax=Rhodococcus sp. NPDC060090 TaxID=3347056 RepID=UPI00364E819D
MELIASLPADTPLNDVASYARRAETLGFDVLHVPETFHDPFVTSVLALAHTTTLVVRTSMVVAFPRSPMVTSYAAWDLAQYSNGRFQLGLASQVRGNIVGRYSTTWTDPVGQLRDYIGSVRAIFTAFQEGSGLHYEGPHYRFDRLQPYFDPGPIDCAPPSFWTGGVNRGMCALAGEVSDGFVCHPAASHPRYLEARIRPALRAGAAGAGRTDSGPRIVVNVRPLVGRTCDEVDACRDERRRELAFLYSTPAYHRQLELLDLPDLGPKLTEMVAAREWASLPSLLTNDVLDRLLPAGTWGELPGILGEWYGSHCDGISLGLSSDPAEDDRIERFVQETKMIPPLHIP